MMRRRSLLAALLPLAALSFPGLLGCGRVVPAGGVPRPEKPGGIESAEDLIPADLDLVVRVDMAQVRSVGPDVSIEMLDKALDAAGVQGAARAALSQADVVWLGLRLADIELGDHVMVARLDASRRGSANDSDPAFLAPERRKWKASETPLASIRRYVAKSSTDRAGTARIYGVGRTAAVFVSPVEEQSVERVIMRGADPERGQPQARGLMSVDVHSPHLPPDLARRYKSIAKLIGGIERVQGVVEIHGQRLVLAATMRCSNPSAAAKVKAYIGTFLDPRTRFAELLGGVSVFREEAVVTLHWKVPREVIVALFADPSEAK